MSKSILRVSLPWPPSINRYWLNGGRTKGAKHISPEGKLFRARAVMAVRQIIPSDWRHYTSGHEFSVRIDAHPPDRRTRDLDNILKAALDALTHAGVYDDDGLIFLLKAERFSVWSPGRIDVEIAAYEPAPTW